MSSTVSAGEPDTWLLTAGREDDDRAEQWISGGYCATSYHDIGYVEPAEDPAPLRCAFESRFPEAKSGTITQWTTQLHTFLWRVQVGHWIAVHDRANGVVYVGEVIGDPTYEPWHEDGFPRRRRMRWFTYLDRSDLPPSALTMQGTIRPVKTHRAEFREAVADLLAEEGALEFPVIEQPSSLGVKYRRQGDRPPPKEAELSRPDPDLTAAGWLAHGILQDRLADEAILRGLHPRSPIGAPAYDLAWTDTDGNFTLVEVKSLNDHNTTAQLRAGLAQLLDYADHFRDRTVRRVLWVERAPAEKERWQRICENAGVVLAWPDEEARVFRPEGALRGGEPG